MKTQMNPNEAATTKVSVIGLGYIGLPTAAILASRGFNVTGVEISATAIATINEGRAHIVEPDLDMLVQAAVSTGKLKAETHPSESDVFIICVPTPLDGSNRADLQYVMDATKQVATVIKSGNMVVLESTSPPGTTERIANSLREQTGLDETEIHVAHAPERVLPGHIIREVIENDRIVGGVTPEATKAVQGFYEHFVRGKVFTTDSRTAETVKLVENAYRDVNIGFANEISLIADQLGIDVWRLISLANKHPRVNILRPGTGVGGHCIAVDPWFLVHSAPEDTRLIRTAREVNDSKPMQVAKKILDKAARFSSPKVACLGLSYKPNVDDLRESPAVEVCQHLASHPSGIDLIVVEPFVASHAEFELADLQSALQQADIVAFLVAHDEFRGVPQTILEEKVVIDACGILRE